MYGNTEPKGLKAIYDDLRLVGVSHHKLLLTL